MSDIHVFDVAESKWYLQSAGGDVPDPRRKFCAGVLGLKTSLHSMPLLVRDCSMLT